jgi:hypothetical protein
MARPVYSVGFGVVPGFSYPSDTIAVFTADDAFVYVLRDADLTIITGSTLDQAILQLSRPTSGVVNLAVVDQSDSGRPFHWSGRITLEPDDTLQVQVDALSVAYVSCYLGGYQLTKP